MPKRLSLKFALHEGGGRARPGNEQPPVMRVESAWSARQFESIFAAQRRQWFGDELQRFADNIAAMLQQEHELSLKWEGLPGTDHPVHWTGAADSLSKAQPQVRAGRRLSVWHPPLAWVMPLVARQPMHLAVHLPLTLNEDALEEMARSALPRGWERQRVVVRLDIETRMYWGARAGNSLATWKPCQRRGDGLSDTIPLFTLRRGRVERRVCGAGDFAPMLARHVPAGIGLLVAVPVFSFERRRVVRQVVDRWWREAWQRIGWVCPDDRDPTFVHRIEADEPFWNDATGAAPLKPSAWRHAVRDSALLRPASAPAAEFLKSHHPSPLQRHVVLLHGGLSSARGCFDALLAEHPAEGRLWPGMPLLDSVCTWRFEHDTFVPMRHNIDRLARWLQREVVRDAPRGKMVLLAHSRGGNVARFALPELRRRFGPGWNVSALTAGAPHLGTQVFQRIGQRWAGLAGVIGTVRQMTQGWLGREQLAQLVILERGLAYEVPPGFHDVEPEGVRRLANGRPHELPDGLWLWGSQWTVGQTHARTEDNLWDWLVEDVGGCEVGGDGLVARESALGGRNDPSQGAHDASPVFHTQYFAHGPTREQMEARLRALLDVKV